MARLSLSLLGPFQATLDGQPLMGFKSNKVRALLAYLAVEADRLHPRDVLAGLLWSGWRDRDALSNLRSALSNLRRVLHDRAQLDARDAEPPFLLVSRSTLQFNPDSDHWLDVTAFTELVEADERDPSAIERLEEAVALHRGSFLEGFSLNDSPGFEEWACFTRERIERQMSSAFQRLAAGCEQRGEYERACSYAWRQLELEPWDEVAHRLAMRSLGLSGQRSAALAQYETCRRLLAEEFSVEPGRETARLYEQIRDGTLRREAADHRVRPDALRPPAVTALTVELPAFLVEDEAVAVERPPFVAREPELLQLDELLELALNGSGRVAFVTGDAGSGKTALIQAFAQRAQARRADVVIAMGNCNAYTGIGDPYSPFRQILALLTSDVEAGWAAGVITREHARRLWGMLPATVRAVVEHGPDLIDTFVPRGALLDRARIFQAAMLESDTRAAASEATSWLARLRELLEQKPAVVGAQQLAIFGQYARVLQALALEAPLILVVDDLQWADAGSIDLLFHLGRQLTGSRVLIIGAYRPEEVALGRRGERHPLDPVVSELRRVFGDTEVDLDQTERWHFLEALLDSEPNQLGLAFREMLYRQTRGHPLFTIELLRGLQERGDLVQDGEGRWIEGPTLDWETLPVRVEAVVAERISRLDQPLRAALRVASVEGEVFTAELVALVLGADEREILRSMSSELDRAHRLIRAESIQRLDEQLLSKYRFRHILFQKYLYGTLDEVERVHLHERVGAVLERLQGAEGQGGITAVELALHFERAKKTDKAIHYLQQAGEEAIRLSAYPEAFAHLTRAVALLKSLPDPANEEHRLDRAEKELSLYLSLGRAHPYANPDFEWDKTVTKARDLCDQIGKRSQLCQILGDLAITHYVRAVHGRARKLAEEALTLAQEADDPILEVLGHWYLGFICFGLGEYTAARAHLGRVISFYDPQQHHDCLVLVRGSDAGVGALAYDASCLWCLGYPVQAAKRSREALTLARRLDHPFSLADAVCFGGCVLNQMRRDPVALKEDAEELIRLSKGLGFSSFLGAGICYWGEALAQLGQLEEGIEQMRRGMAEMRAMGGRCYASGTLGALAAAQATAGQPEEGLVTLAEALAMVEETEERYYEAELRRLRGELLLAQGHEADAELSFCEAIEVSRRQGAKSWELRATVSLCRLWQEQAKREEARQCLAEMYGWFTEGFDTPDLREARTLLKKLEQI